MASPTILHATNPFSGLIGSTALVAGDLVYHDGTDWEKADATDRTKAAVAIATVGGRSGDTGHFAAEAILSDTDAPYTVGNVQYLSTTAGGHTSTAPSTVTNLVQPIGIALSTSLLHVVVRNSAPQAHNHQLNDDVRVYLGTSGIGSLYSNGTDSYFTTSSGKVIVSPTSDFQIDPTGNTIVNSAYLDSDTIIYGDQASFAKIWVSGESQRFVGIGGEPQYGSLLDINGANPPAGYGSNTYGINVRPLISTVPLGADQAFAGIRIGPQGVKEAASGTHADIHGLHLVTFTITDGGGTETVTNVANLYVAGAPTVGTTPTNGPYSIFVDAGDSRFDGKVETGANVGTANTGVTAKEYGDGHQHTTVLTVSQVDALTTADNAAIADGYLLYTLPAGAVVIDYAYMTMGMTSASTEQQTDTPDVGLGTVIASGAVAVLGGTATFENIITGQTATDANGTATVKTALPTAGVPFVIESGDAHTIHFNVADTWADDTGADLTADIAGTVVIVWRFLA